MTDIVERGSDILSTHVARTVEDAPNMIGVPMVICRLSRMLGFGIVSEYMPFLYGMGHTLSVTGSYDSESIMHAIMSGVQSHYICQNFGLQ
tara:strand:+ start:898 stop:1170 length:273 start_codon:yes stop_codon:yes gene_type:complete